MASSGRVLARILFWGVFPKSLEGIDPAFGVYGHPIFQLVIIHHYYGTISDSVVDILSHLLAPSRVTRPSLVVYASALEDASAILYA